MSAARATVVMPAHRCAATLRRAAAALHAGDLPRAQWELVVVDDASGDDTASVAASVADRVVRVADGPRGPAHARNRGVEAGTGDVLVFVDADVCVHPDTLRRLLAALDAEPDVGAVFGAYDTRPAAPGLVSRYANLVHHRTHALHAGDAETFWAGCGAMRRSVFEDAGGFDERRYPRPQIEDVELGHRVRDIGWRIRLRPEIQCTHLKRWTLRGLVVTNVRDRGVPWVRLLLEERRGGRAATLSLRPAEQVHTALVGLALGAAAAAAVARDARWLGASGLALAAVLAGNLPLLRWLGRIGGTRLALAGVPLRLLHYLTNGISVVWGTAAHVRAGGRRRRVRAPRAPRAPRALHARIPSPREP